MSAREIVQSSFSEHADAHLRELTKSRILIMPTTIVSGFTLVELSVVLVLVSLLSGTAAMMVRMPLAEAQRQQSVSQVQALDSLARRHARGGNEIVMEFDRSTHVVRVVDSKKRGTISQMSLAGNLQIVGFRINRNEGITKQAITYDRFGTSASFAVAIGREGSEPKWLLVLGTTGQAYLDETKETVDAILARERNHSR